MLYNARIIIVWRAWYSEVRYLKVANWSEVEILKLIELCSEDSLAPRELGGSLAPIGPRGALIQIHFIERTCKRSAYMYIHAHISCSYDHVTF